MITAQACALWQYFCAPCPDPPGRLDRTLWDDYARRFISADGRVTDADSGPPGITHTEAQGYGLLLAEANALGTPVIAPPVGAAPEIVGDPRQAAPLGDAVALAARIRAWQQGGRPRPTADPRFSPERVARDWLTLLESA